MKAAFLADLRRLDVREAPEPRLDNPRDVLLRIETVGVCGSDLHYFRAGGIGAQVVKFPWVVGHECAGTVLEIGPEVQHLRPGQLVVVDPLVACGGCDQCLAGRPHTCRRQRFLGCPGQLAGAMAERLILPGECCFPVPEGMTAVQATLVEPFSIGLYAQRMAHLHDGAKLAILGCGPIGLCALMACRAPAIQLAARGTVNLDRLATHHFPLAEAQAAFELVDGYRDGVLKALVHL
jgi:L-iditol 2-dehydrogenase